MSEAGTKEAEKSSIPQKYIELWERHAQSPVPDSLWEEVISLAGKEERNGKGEKGIYGQVPLGSLLSLAEKARNEKDPLARYKLLTEIGPTGEIWFNILDGLSSPPTIRALSEYLGKRPEEKGLELGTGTGNLSQVLEGCCQSLTSLDQADYLLKIARQNAEGRGNYVQAKAFDLPFKDDSFDFAVSSGLTSSFTKRQLRLFAKELYRVLKDDSSYIDAFLYTPEDPYKHFEKSLESAKGILADMIVDEITGSAQISSRDQIDGLREFLDIFQGQGFDYRLTNDEERGVFILELFKSSVEGG